MAVCKLGIHKEKGQWVVDTPPKKVTRGVDTVEWEIHGSKKDAVAAFFQFPAVDLFTNMPGRDDLTKHRTAKISGPGETLTLLVSASADRRQNPYYYAVWVNDPSLPGGGAYAVGGDRNPPPEIIVGP